MALPLSALETHSYIAGCCCCERRRPDNVTDIRDLALQIGVISLNNASENNATEGSEPGSNPLPGPQSSSPPHSQSSLSSSVDTLQLKWKKRVGREIQDMKHELCAKCFSLKFLPAPEGTLRPNIDSLPLLVGTPFRLTSPSDQNQRQPWPNANEKACYKPLVKLLNEIVDHVSPEVGPGDGEGVKFIDYDKEMAPVTPRSLKPDILLIANEFDRPENRPKNHPWKNPILTLEVKSNFSDALNQLGTYAREMYSARPGRHNCWALYFDHLTFGFRAVLFTPDSVHYTESICIKTKAGYREMANILAALLVQPNLLTIGEDLSRDYRTKILPNGDRLKIESVEFDRKTVMGRKTRVISVIAVAEDAILQEGDAVQDKKQPVRRSARLLNSSSSLGRAVFSASPGPQGARSTPPTTTKSSSNSRRPQLEPRISSTSSSQSPLSARPVPSGDSPENEEGDSSTLKEDAYILKQHESNSSEGMNFADDSRNRLKIGERLVVKESCPLLSRKDIEWEALKSCLGKFGVPEVVYKVTGKDCTDVPWVREPRILQQIAMKEKGSSLIRATSPRDLLTSVLHAIVGHWNLFMAGWLHRDVSIGNIMMLEDAAFKQAPKDLHQLLENQTNCSGILIDGDAMIHLSREREPGSHRSFTPPFLSIRLVEAWLLRTETFDQYFDDLESFAWVLLWALIQIAQADRRATGFDNNWMKSLSSSDLLSLTAGKRSIYGQLSELSHRASKSKPKRAATSLFDPFITLLHQWLDMIREAEPEGMETETLPSSPETTAFYGRFISLGLQKLELLPEKWRTA